MSNWDLLHPMHSPLRRGAIFCCTGKLIPVVANSVAPEQRTLKQKPCHPDLRFPALPEATTSPRDAPRCAEFIFEVRFAQRGPERPQKSNFFACGGLLTPCPPFIRHHTSQTAAGLHPMLNPIPLLPYYSHLTARYHAIRNPFLLC